MKNTLSVYMIIVVALTGCAAPILPAFVTAPEPPLEWKVLLEKKVGCPDVTGEYELTPTVAILQNDSEWSFSNGKWYDYLMLIPFDRVTADKSTRDGNSLAYSPGSLPAATRSSTVAGCPSTAVRRSDEVRSSWKSHQISPMGVSAPGETSEPHTLGTYFGSEM